ncbi:site-specific DNA-methyltransferase [Thiothrix subterranea]|uniref:site-specific DNA-methyltransferase n=1 Tax=Thiothrix subterranea TaxID=2735563 RepID=UPI00192AA476|nr:site-specific DNA-methyltransferase [Thiothrix subterranea]QQZ30502.1 site-specific DNA-methyltransferase [Thiothrix subterranea]
MPLLDWLNKPASLQTARLVPYRLLECVPALGYGATPNPNLLIQGDNLEALKALLPLYAGRIKCIYIDPPYNTRSAFEHYDDNLEHSQWLSMMYPRLELLRDLLAEDGSLWVSIDDHEGHYLKVMLDEIFGRKNFIANVVWQSRYSRSNDASLSVSHNFILAYAIDPDVWKLRRNKLQRTDEQAKQYTNPDNDPKGAWRAIPWDAPNIRPNLEYPIITSNGKVRVPPPGRHWSRTEDQWLAIVASGLAYFGKSGDGAPAFKQYLAEAQGIVPNTWWGHEEAGHTDEAKKEIQTLFGRDNIFDTPKPERLIERILHIATNPGDWVLDSFLGSGTTAAVAHKMGRHYIGVEMGDHAVTHCQPRLQKVVDGEQGGISKAVNWQGGGGFTFCRLGATVFDEYGMIDKAIRFPTLAAYIWYLETRTPWIAPDTLSPLLGIHDGTAYYLLYNGILGDRRPQGGNVLTQTVLDGLPKHPGKRVIYGETSRFGAGRLAAEGITFKQIPYDVRVG